MQLLEKFEVALRINKDEVIIPSLMLEECNYSQPDSDLNDVSGDLEHYQPTMRRIWFSNYIPDGFWPRLICRIMTDQQIKSILSMYKDTERFTHLNWKCWRNGIVFTSRGRTLVIVHLFPNPVTFESQKEHYDNRIEVHICIPEMITIVQELQENDNFDMEEEESPSCHGTRLMVAISNHIMFLSSWFHGMLSNDSGYIPCWKCCSNLPTIDNNSKVQPQTGDTYIMVDSKLVYCLSFDSCIVPACTGKDFECVNHGTLKVVQTAPDLVC